MRKLLAVIAATVVWAMPTLAQADWPDQTCDLDPGMMASSPPDLRSLRLPGELPHQTRVLQAEESWQEEAREGAERRSQHLAECCED